MSHHAATTVLKAAADPSRLRLLALLAAGEATVKELVDIIGQSQPRVSRHLKILADARIVTHFRDGQWMYYRLEPSGAAAELVDCAVALARSGDETLSADRERLAEVRAARERYALTAPSGPKRWVGSIGDRPSEAALEQALLAALGGGELGDLLDIGVGSGAVLRLLAPRCRTAVGLDVSRGMRVLARSRLQGAGLGRCTIRAGDMHELPFPELSFDLVVVDEVLSLATDPQPVLAEATRVLRPTGRLLVLDRIEPAALRLTSQSGKRALYENQLAVMLRAVGLRASAPSWFPGRRLDLAWVTASARSVR